MSFMMCLMPNVPHMKNGHPKILLVIKRMVIAILHYLTLFFSRKGDKRDPVKAILWAQENILLSWDYLCLKWMIWMHQPINQMN